LDEADYELRKEPAFDMKGTGGVKNGYLNEDPLNDKLKMEQNQKDLFFKVMNEGQRLSTGRMIVYFFDDIDNPLNVTSDKIEKMTRIFKAVHDCS
jgi:hypothetical protein